MELFEFVMVLVSIIAGLAIATLLGGIARVLRGELEGYWVHHVWVLNVFLLLIQNFWSQFNLEGRSEWTLVDLTGLLIPPMTLFLVSSLLFPGPSGDRDLARFYSSKHKSIFGLLVGLAVYYFLVGLTFSVADLLLVPAIAVLVALFLTERRRIHAILTPGYAVGFLAFMLLFTFTLGASKV